LQEAVGPHYLIIICALLLAFSSGDGRSQSMSTERNDQAKKLPEETWLQHVSSDSFFDFYYGQREKGWNSGGVRWAVRNISPFKLKVWTIKVLYGCDGISKESKHYIAKWLSPNEQGANVGHDYPCKGEISSVSVVDVEFQQQETTAQFHSQNLNCGNQQKGFVVEWPKPSILRIKTNDGESYTTSGTKLNDGTLAYNLNEIATRLCGETAPTSNVINDLRYKFRVFHKARQKKACANTEANDCTSIPKIKFTSGTIGTRS